MFNKLNYKERNFLQSANPIISVIWPWASFPYNLKKKKKLVCFDNDIYNKIWVGTVNDQNYGFFYGLNKKSLFFNKLQL